MTQALALSGVVFLVLSIAGAFTVDAMSYYDDHRGQAIRAAWTSLGLSATLFLAAIWTHALTTGG